MTVLFSLFASINYLLQVPILDWLDVGYQHLLMHYMLVWEVTMSLLQIWVHWERLSWQLPCMSAFSSLTIWTSRCNMYRSLACSLSFVLFMPMEFNNDFASKCYKYVKIFLLWRGIALWTWPPTPNAIVVRATKGVIRKNHCCWVRLFLFWGWGGGARWDGGLKWLKNSPSFHSSLFCQFIDPSRFQKLGKVLCPMSLGTILMCIGLFLVVTSWGPSGVLLQRLKISDPYSFG